MSAATRAPALPRRLQVEVTAACNLSCRMCIVNYRPKLPRSASMSFDSFSRLLDDLPGLEELVLQGIGEPLLAPDLYRMIAKASERGIRTEFNTNATLLTVEAGKRLVGAGLSALHISFDAARREVYEFIRGNSDFEVVHRNISNFAAFLREDCGPELDVSLVMVLMRENLDELPGVIRAAAGWGFESVFVQGLSHDFSDADGGDYEGIAAFVDRQHIDGLPRWQVEASFERARGLAARLGVELRLPPLDEQTKSLVLDDGSEVHCTWPWEGGYVARDGTVMPCCMVMGEGRVALGNVHESSYEDIWSSARFREFREGLRPGGTPHRVCQGCAMYRGRF